MRKILCLLFILFLFSTPIFFQKFSINEILTNDKELNFDNYYNFKNCFNSIDCTEFISCDSGEQIEFNSQDICISKILDLLGARIVEVINMSSCKVINAVSRNVKYRNQFDKFNIQIKTNSKSTIVASPKFLF